MTLLYRLLPILISTTILGIIIWQIEPPKTITQISALQIFLLVTPLLILIVFTVNLCFNFWMRSMIVSIGSMLLIVLRTLDKLNLVTASITIVATYLLAKSCKRGADIKPPSKAFKLSRLQKQR